LNPPNRQKTSGRLLLHRPGSIPFTRAASVSNFITYLNRIGVPTERYLRQARIPLSLFDDPETPVPLHLCYRFAELVTRKEGIDDLGLLVAQNTSLPGLGKYGQVLSQSLTVFDYLNTGITLLNRFTSGENLRLEAHGNNLRLYHAVPRGAIEASNQSQLFTLMFTINILRSVTGNAWSPEELHIAGISSGKLVNVEALANTRIMYDEGPAYFTLPRSMLELPFKPKMKRQPLITPENTISSPDQHADNFLDSLAQLVEILLQDGYPDIELAAEAAGLNRRTFQRYLADLGLSYSQVVENTRMQLACRWLETTSMPVMDIALALGYTDTSNFTRAFRRRAGIPPRRYREQTRGS
jgi:AraC-like DNA-binding protein